MVDNVFVKDNHNKPYFEKDYSCPVCKKSSNHYFLKKGSYTIGKREEDYFVSNYRWDEPEFYHYNLYTFKLWHCTHCKYTGESQYFYKKEIYNGQFSFKYLKKILLDENFKDKNPVVNLLLANLEYPTHDLIPILSLHILAIYLHNLVEDIYQDKIVLAQLYLKLSWLFRIASQRPQLKGMENFIINYFSNYDSLCGLIENSEASLDEQNLMISEVFSEKKPSELKGFLESNKNSFTWNHQTMQNAFDVLKSGLKKYRCSGEELQEYYNSASAIPIKLSYNGYSTYADFLENVKLSWPEVPLNEQDALKSATIYFQKAIAAGCYESNRIKLFNVFKLIIVLHEKTGDFRTALNSCDALQSQLEHTQKVALKRLGSLKRIKDDTVNPDHLKTLVKRTETFLIELGHKKKALLKVKLKHDQKIAQQIFSENQELPPDILKERLKKERIEKSVISQFVPENEGGKLKSFLKLLNL